MKHQIHTAFTKVVQYHQHSHNTPFSLSMTSNSQLAFEIFMTTIGVDPWSLDKGNQVKVIEASHLLYFLVNFIVIKF